MSSKLKSVRAAHRGAVTRLLNRVKGNPVEILQEHNVNELSTIIDLIRNKEKTILDLDSKILEEISEEEHEEEITEADRYTFDIQMTISKLSTIIDNANTSNPSLIRPIAHSAPSQHISLTSELNPHATEYVSQHTSATVNDTQARPAHCPTFPQATMSTSGSVYTNASTYHKLPKLNLPSFGGNMLDWQPFWDSFSAAVHDNLSLNDVQKFSYLKSQLYGEASQCIAGLQITNTNYIQALQVLKRRFGQPHKIIDAYMQNLISLPSPTSDIKELKDFYDGMENYIRGLESIGQSYESYGSLLVPIILNKIPESIKENLVRAHGSDQWTLPLLREGIEKEITIKEASRSANSYSTIQPAEFTPTSAFVANAKRNQMKINITSKPCIFCNDVHAPITCTKVKSLDERKRVIKEKHLCFNCLGNHKIAQCKSQKTCKNCPGKRHHTSICAKLETDQKTEQKPKTPGKTDTTCATTVANMHSSTFTPMRSHVLLKTAVAPVSSDEKQFQSANILFDEGAQRSFITREMANILNLKPHQTESISITGFGETNKKVRHLEIATIYLKTQNTELIPMDVLIVPQIAQPIQTYARKSSNFQYLNGLKLAHPTDRDENFDISILVGADYFWDIVEDQIIRGPGPTAVKSKVGYLLSGPTYVNCQQNPKLSSVMNILTYHKGEECQIHKFWEIESTGTENYSEVKSKIAQDEMNTYQTSSITFENGKYIARFPWKQNHPELPSNETIAKRRTRNVITRLSKDPEMLKMYDNIIKEQEEKGFIEKTNNGNQQSDGIIHYIPHHPVKKDSSTTPIRVVYDCSCRANSDSPSLNDCLSSSPPQLNRLTDILTRFRCGKYALTTDIEKAFLQVGLNELDRDSTRFFWMRDPNDPNSELDTYRFKVVLFGATCSPFILSATLLKHLSMNPSTTSDISKRDLYVDNVLTSFENEEMALKFYGESRELLKRAGFNLRSWKSNSIKIMDIATQENIVDTDMDSKILGMRWDANSDSLTFAKQEIQNAELEATKREILRQSSSIFDPLGILGPVTVRAKILIQKLWKDGYEWDEILPEDISKEWIDIRNDIREVTNNTKLSRYYFTEKDTDNSDTTLHVFVDASQQAYGASAYISKGNSTALVIAKNRVAPVKRITLPKLELMAAVIGTRIATQLRENLNVKRIVMWSDSQIVLHWIASKKTLCRFVQNRINEIRKLDCHWNYIPTDSNPADLQTRGITAAHFKESSLWRNGPTWINDEECWPRWTPNLKSDISILTTTQNSSKKETLDFTSQVNGISRIIDITRFSSLQRLLHVTCYMIRFVKRCNQRKYNLRLRSNRKHVTNSLTKDEIRYALNLWILDIQNSSFSDEKNALTSTLRNSQLPLIRQLRLFIDQEGIIRCAGRIQNSDLDYNAKHPILLPKKNAFTELVIVDAHHRLLHAGAGQTITFIRQSYWIPSIRQSVNYILRRCIQCRKVTGKPYTKPVSPPLPKDRVNDVKPFSTTGIDFAGPLYVKDNKKTLKAYVCLFTCACIRAVHLELVADMTLESFMLAFRRFVSRRGAPTTIYSDNAPTFISADKEIPKSMNIHVNWKFIPKAAPWYGGWWERLIGITKISLKKVLGRSQVIFEVLRTVLTEIECVINDRPITYISSDIRDLQPLTPSQLLHGRNISSYDFSMDNSENRDCLNCESANRMMNRKTSLIEHFAKRWVSYRIT